MFLICSLIIENKFGRTFRDFLSHGASWFLSPQIQLLLPWKHISFVIWTVSVPEPFPSDPLTQGGPIPSNSFSLLFLYIFPFSLENLALTWVQFQCATISVLTCGRDSKNSKKFRTFSLSLLFIIFITRSKREGRDLAEMQITATLKMSLCERLKSLKAGWSSLKCCRDRGVQDTHHAHLVFMSLPRYICGWDSRPGSSFILEGPGKVGTIFPPHRKWRKWKNWNSLSATATWGYV